MQISFDNRDTAPGIERATLRQAGDQYCLNVARQSDFESTVSEPLQCRPKILARLQRGRWERWKISVNLTEEAFL
jgi:hypothetical protein